MEHLFDVAIAKKYGVNAAIMIRHFQFWIIKNKGNGKHLHDGRTWTYCSVKAFTEIFPYWSHRQVRVILDKLFEEKVLLKGCYNFKGYDHTTWYAFGNENRFVRIDQSICQNRPMDLSKRADGTADNDQPIPNPTTNVNIDKNKTKEVEISAQKRLDLDLLIAQEKKFFTEQLTDIFHHFNKREFQTFARITAYLISQCQKDKLPVSIFKDAVGWARQAQDSNAVVKKALFVAKIKEETGFQKQKNLLRKTPQKLENFL